jgi:hypothetical protein
MAAKAIEKIKQHKLPCGPMDVSINSVCRRRLHDHFDALLDRLCEECHPVPPEKDVPKEWMEEPEETMEEQKARLLDEGKMKAEVKVKVKEHEQKLMGNSKLLADPKQKVTTRNKR